jgi:SRSO17 transposase
MPTRCADVVRSYAIETLAEPDAVLVVDETGFLKQGRSSCGVGRQYTGSAGKITNCQIGVFSAYVSGKGHAFIDRALYLPKIWTDDRARRTAAHVPESVTFATKPQLARSMIERAIQAGVPFAWVAADSIYGVGEIEMALRRAGKGYVLGSAARISSTRGWASPPSPARPRASPKTSTRPRGSASRRERAPRASGSRSGPIASWPTSDPATTAPPGPGYGRAGS